MNSEKPKRQYLLPDLHTTANVADTLCLSPQRIRQLIAELKIEPSRIGGAIVLTQVDIDRMRARNKTRGRPRKAR